jgi:predicted MFS family arabinose efflux permease
MNRAVFAVGLVGFCAFLGLYATQPLLPMLEETFHASKLAVSLTISMATLGVALAAPWVGVLAELRGRKKVIVPAVWLLGLTYLVAALARDLSWLTSVRFIQGVLTPAVFAVTVAYVNEEWPRGEASFVTSVYVSGTVLGGFTGRLLSGLLAPHLGWQGAFILLGILELGLACAVSAWLPKARHFERSSGLRQALVDMASHLKNGSLLTIYAIGFTVLFSLVSTFSYVTFHLAARPFFLGTAALGMLSTVYLVGVIVTPLTGRWASHTEGWKLLAIAQGTSILGLLLTLIPSLLAVILGLTLCSSGVFVSQLVTNRSIGIVAGQARASAVGLYVTIYYLGGFVGSTAPGVLWAYGGWKACVALVLLVLVGALLVTLLSWRPRERRRLLRESKSRAEAIPVG